MNTKGSQNFKNQYFQTRGINELKAYLCYKTITSQNVSSESQVKNFLFRRRLYYVLKILKFLDF